MKLDQQISIAKRILAILTRARLHLNMSALRHRAIATIRCGTRTSRRCTRAAVTVDQSGELAEPGCLQGDVGRRRWSPWRLFLDDPSAHASPGFDRILEAVIGHCDRMAQRDQSLGAMDRQPVA